MGDRMIKEPVYWVESLRDLKPAANTTANDLSKPDTLFDRNPFLLTARGSCVVLFLGSWGIFRLSRNLRASVKRLPPDYFFQG